MSTTQLLPWAPLEAVALHWIQVRHLDHNGHGEPATIRALAAVLNVNRKQIYRWRQAGGIDLDTADRLALELNQQPCEIWAEWDDDPEALEFAAVWSELAPEYMRIRRADALAESCRLRDFTQSWRTTVERSVA